jgi:hypothetical protein
MQTFPYQRLTGYVDRLQVRMVGLEQGKKALLESLETVDNAMRLYDESCGRLIEIVNEQRNRGLEGLRKARREIEVMIQEAISEATGLIYEDQAELKNPLSALLQGSIPPEFSLFTYSIEEEKVVQAISTLLNYELKPSLVSAPSRPLPVEQCKPPAPSAPVRPDPPLRDLTKLPRVEANNYRFFNFETRVWHPEIHLARKIDCDEGTSYVFLGEEAIFCCGGNCNGQYTSAAYLLEAGVVTVLKSLSIRRGFAGVILVGDCTYVFGGVNRSGISHLGLLQQCSRIRNKGPGVWEEMPDLQHGRAHFNPCFYRNFIYLMGGCRRDSIEMFSPAALTVVTLRAKMFTSCLSHHNNWKPSPNSPPVVRSDFAFIIHEDEVCWCNVQTGQLVGYH